jgi:Protein of unknown function (DUF3500)
MSTEDLAGQMRADATALLAELTAGQRELAARPFTDDLARRWLEYRPEARPGACLAGFSGAARKAAHRLLSAALSEHAFAQAMGIVALEEVLDRREERRRNRHSADYWVAVFGDPQGAAPWSWRFEGHHVSVTMTIAGQEVAAAPLFLGANPAQVSYAGRPVSRPLGPEEDLARALLDALGPAGRAAAVVSGAAPADIRSGPRAAAPAGIEPAGVAASALGASAAAALDQLLALYLDRLPPALAARESARVHAGERYFAWEGPLTPGIPHYYRIQGEDLLIEYDDTDAGNHAHTVLRRPRGDFGADLLAAHYREAHAG